MDNNQVPSSTTQAVPMPMQPANPPPIPPVPLPSNSSFSIGEAIKFGWNTTLRNFGFLILSALVVVGYIIVLFIVVGVLATLFKDNGLVFAIINIAVYLLELIIILGYYKVYLKLVDNQKPQLSDLFREYPRLISYAIGSFLYAVAILVGFILLIIPGVIFAMRFAFYPFIIVDKGANPIDALKMSWAITRGQTIKLFLFGLALSVVYFLGFLALGVGLLISVPTVLIAYTYVYRKLLPQTPGI